MGFDEQKDEVKKTEDQSVESKDSTTASCSSVSDGSADRSRIAPVTASPIDRRTSDPFRELGVLTEKWMQYVKDRMMRAEEFSSRTEKAVNQDLSKGTWTHASCSSKCGCSAGSSTIASPATTSPIHRSRRRRTSGPIRRAGGGWTPEEDEKLRQAVETCNEKHWKKIAESLDGRTDVQCLHRWQKVLHPDLIKGPWTQEEDKRIIELVEVYGPTKWSLIANSLPGRIGKQCRERWHNHLDPTINKNPWTSGEEKILMEAHRVYGNKWAKLSELLPGRTDNSIKNHWNCSLKKRSEFYLSTGRLRPSMTAARNRVDNENELVSQTPSRAADVNNPDEVRIDPITSSDRFEELEIATVNERARSPQALEPEPLPENPGVILNGEQCMFGNEPAGSTPIASHNCFVTPSPCSNNLNTVMRKLSEAARTYQNRPSILRKRTYRIVVPDSTSAAAETDEVKEVVDEKVNDDGEGNIGSSVVEDVEYNGTETQDLSPPYSKKTKGKVVIEPRQLESEFTSEEEEKKGDD